ncbi:MAG TPA: metallophosphoesterase family protein [Candidatus Baltobacteraceae bacterium]|nr:metallophosphoesterase family protein [Candidatus Baltobacteraceae bacterium]
MRYAVFSDIHGNLESLERAFALLESGDRVLCLGDIVGYGPNPNECVRMIRDRAHQTVLGNHDVAAVDNFGVEYFNPAARRAIEWTQSVIEPDVVDWLNGLSYEIRDQRYLLVHGAPVHYFEYLLDKRHAKAAFERTDAPIIFVGHTHIAEYYALEPDGTVSHQHMQNGGELALETGKRYIIDVGSIGQPRDLNPQASFVLFDDAANVVKWIRYDYPIREVQQKIVDAELPHALAARLDVGR